MKNKLLIPSLVPLLALVMALGAVAVSAANVTLTASDVNGTVTSLNGVGKWNNSAAPSAANDYYTGAFFVRTPAVGTGGLTYTFAGNSLTLQAPGNARSIIFKGGNNDTIIINNLTNAFGGILENGGSGNLTVTYTGNRYTIAANSAIVANQGPLIVGYPLVGASGVILTNAGGNGTGIRYDNDNSGFKGKFYLSTVNFGNGGGNTTVILNTVNSAPGNPATFTPDQILINNGCTLLDNAGITFNNVNGGITLLGPGNGNINTATTTIMAEPITDVTNSVSSVASLTKTGAGTLALNAVNSYSGGTIISAGTLQVGVANALPLGNVTVASALDLNANSATINGLSGAGTVDTTTGGTPTLTVGAAGGGGTFSGIIQNSAGTLGLTKVGAGTLTFSSGYTYSGQTLVAGGTLSLVTSGALPSAAGNLVVSNGATVTVDASGGVALPANNLVVGSNSTLNVTLNSAATGLTVTGNLTWQDNATNTFNYGTLLANPTALAINASGNLAASGANLVINITALGLQPGTFSLIKYTGAALGSIANFSLNLPPGVAGILVNNTGNNSLDIQITSIPNQLAWNGVNGTSWDLATANWTNLVTGAITVFRQYTNGSIVAGDTVVLDDSVTNDFVNAQPTNLNLTVRFYAFPFTVNSTLPYSISGAGGLIGSTSLVKSNTGSLTLNTSNSYTGGTYVYGGDLIITNDSALGATNTLVTLNGGNLAFSGNSTNNVRPLTLPVAASIGVAAGATARVGGAISGAGALRKVDVGTLTLAGSNSIAGSIFVKAGTLVLDSGAVIASPGGIWASIGQDGADVGTMTLKGTAIFRTSSDFNLGDLDTSVGTLNIQDTAVLTANSIYVASANNAGSTAMGTVNQTGGSVTESNNAVGTFAIGGRTSAGGVGVYNLSGGTLTATAGIRVGGFGTGTFNQSGGTLVANGGINIARLAGSTGTYNLDGGLFQTLNVASSTSSNSVFNFNGGTLKPTTNAATTTFFQGLASTFVRNGGAIVDVTNLNLTIAQPLLHSTNVADAATDGGLTKKGSGTLTLTGANTFTGSITNVAGTLVLNSTSIYSGALLINAGLVQLTPASTVKGFSTVSNNATLAVVQVGSASATVSNLTFNGAATLPGATLALTPATANNPTVALVNCGVLTLNGTNTISLAAANVGTLALVKYTALAGSGNVTNLSLPQGGTGYVSNSVANSTLYVVVTSAGPGLVWTGTNGVSPNLWDIGTTTNWLVGSASTSYHQIITPGDAVTFNDIGSGTVTLNTGVAPASLQISNVSKTYTFSGSGTLSGATSLLKLGSGGVVLNLTNNSYTGSTIVSNGTLTVANTGAGSGLSPVANLLIGTSGTLQLSSQQANATTTVAELSGGGTLNYTGGNNSILAFGGSVGGTWNGSLRDNNGGGLSLTKTGAGTWVVGGSNYLNNGDAFNGFSQVQLNGGTTILTNNSLVAVAVTEFWIGQGAGSTSSVVVAGGTLAVSNNWLCVGRGDATASGSLTVNSGSVIKLGANNLVVGSAGSSGTLTVNGGQVLNSSMLWLGENATGNGTLQLNGGLVQATQVRPNGATPVTSLANFNGGTLQASAASADFIQATAMVQSNGLVLDDGGFVVTLASAPLQEDAASIGGGLIKKGAGTVYLDTANTYTGTTVVTNGTLAGSGSINGPVVVAPAGNLGAGNASGIGTLTLNAQPLTVQGQVTMRISKTGGTPAFDQLAGLSAANYGGTLVISNITSDATPLTTGDTFQLFSVAGSATGNFSLVGSPGTGLAYSFNPANGLLSVVTGIATNSTNITATVSGNTLTLTWPADHTGWTLQAQTNNLSAGLGTNWVNVPGSTASNTNISTINPANPAVFYRLILP